MASTLLYQVYAVSHSLTCKSRLSCRITLLSLSIIQSTHTFRLVQFRKIFPAAGTDSLTPAPIITNSTNQALPFVTTATSPSLPTYYIQRLIIYTFFALIPKGCLTYQSRTDPERHIELDSCLKISIIVQQLGKRIEGSSCIRFQGALSNPLIRLAIGITPLAYTGGRWN